MTLPLFFILKTTTHLPINHIMLNLARKLTTTLITLLSLTLFTPPLQAKDYLIGGGDVLECTVPTHTLQFLKNYRDPFLYLLS
jgi:hypothetical protein